MKQIKKLKKYEINDVLAKGEYAVLAITDGNEPYTLPLSYGLDKEHKVLYFLTEKEGMKLDFLKSNPYVCGNVIVNLSLQGDSQTGYQSVVFRGVMEVIHNTQDQKMARLLIEEGHRFTLDEKEMKNPMIMKLEMDEIEGRSF